jgi:beta-lactamase regulating signal transducer with metallopeptidase domain
MPWTAAAGIAGLAAGSLLRTTFVLTLALVAAAAARRRPAAFRHFLLSSALVGLLLLPFLGLAPVGWRSALVPRWMAPAAGPAPGPETGTRAGAPSPSPIAAAAVRESPPERTTGGSAAYGPAKASTEPTGRTAAATTAAHAAGSAGDRRRPIDLLIAFLWPAGLAVLVLRLGIGLAGALKLTAEGRPLGGPAWRALLERFLALVPLRRKVRLKSHPEVLVPLTWGWRRPVVIMPPDADAWPEEHRSSALFHELSHIKRADFTVMLLVRASLAVFWWNPLCWVVYRELLKEQELACDELVLRAGVRPSSYAASLLAFRRSAGLRWNPSAALLGLLGRASFQDRLAAILKQKFTFMEVKMRTKIMLASALVLAVALVGTARPVAGSASGGTVTVLAEATLPAPASFEAAAPGPVQETKAEQEKAKEAQKAKAAEKAKAAVEKTIVISPRSAGGKPIEIVITEGGETETLVVDKPLTITKAKDGDVMVLSVDGKEVRVLKGGTLRLEIKGGELKAVREPGLIKIDEGGAIKIVKEGGEEGKAVVYYGTVKPEVVVEAKPEIVVEAKPHVVVKVGKDVKEGEPTIAWTIKEGGKEGLWIGKEGQAFSVARLGESDMLEKVRALQEQVQAIKAKKMDLSALEESLKKLEAELKAKEEKLKEIELKLDKAPGEFKIVKRIGEGKAESKAGVWVIDEAKPSGTGQAKVMVGIGDENERAINMVFTGQTGEAGRAEFEKALAALKQELPAGYKIVEQKHDADKGTMTFKVEAPEGGKTDAAFIRKLVDTVKNALKSGK